MSPYSVERGRLQASHSSVAFDRRTGGDEDADMRDSGAMRGRYCKGSVQQARKSIAFASTAGNRMRGNGSDGRSAIPMLEMLHRQRVRVQLKYRLFSEHLMLEVNAHLQRIRDCCERLRVLRGYL